jgi:hypothetical protein
MDQHPNFTGKAFTEILENWNVKPRFGAVGKKGSIAVTERVNKTLKYDRLTTTHPADRFISRAHLGELLQRAFCLVG